MTGRSLNRHLETAPEQGFVISRDARGSLVHVRRRDRGDGTSAVAECIGCIEAGLFEIVRALVLEERDGRGSRGGELPATAAASPDQKYDEAG